MVKIMSDTSTLYSIKEGEKNNVIINPLSVTINEETYKEYEEISPKEFIGKINGGNIPSTSQPSIGNTVELYENNKEDDILNITMSDGLSGTYSSACTAREMVDNKDNIYVLNSRTLCGPQRYLVNKAVELANKDYKMKEIIEVLEDKISNSKSFLIPKDFDFLRRGGRLTPIAAKIGSMLKLIPVLTITEDGSRLEKFSLKRTISSAVDIIVDEFQKMNVNEEYIIYICHAGDEATANKCKERIKRTLTNTEIEIFELSPVFIAQGGPECISIQTIKK